jgi:arylsulfatase
MMAVYAAIVSHMDRAIGRLMSELKSLGVLDNTLVLLTSDNGANAETGPDGILTGDHPGDARSSVAAGMEWSTLSNTPFRYFKHFAGEGGIANPLIVSWPNGIDRSLNGTHVKGMSHLVDVMATLLDVTGTPYPKSYKGHELVPLQGRSFASTFRGRALPPVLRRSILSMRVIARYARNSGSWCRIGASPGPCMTCHGPQRNQRSGQC